MIDSTHSVKIIKIITESEHVKRIITEKPITFIAGQFVTFYFTINNKQIERSYSIASSPHESFLEFCISIKKDGLISPKIFELQVNDSLIISEAKGNFTLDNCLEKNVVFIATGTGIAPFISMIKSAIYGNKLDKKYSIIFGNRLKNNILYFDFLTQLPQEFTFFPCLSRDNNYGHFGYVHDIYLSEFNIKSDIKFYVCGWQQMCADVRKNLKLMGYNRKQYVFEDYGL